ncbi:MAG: hypothetical protein JWQ57_981 [Mucilaginibacter sp.]|nr:hypothetical protein [Mucilaginibacter sp.]
MECYILVVSEPEFIEFAGLWNFLLFNFANSLILKIPVQKNR